MLLEINSLTKRFGPITAVDNVLDRLGKQAKKDVIDKTVRLSKQFVNYLKEGKATGKKDYAEQEFNKKLK